MSRCLGFRSRLVLRVAGVHVIYATGIIEGDVVVLSNDLRDPSFQTRYGTSPTLLLR